MTCRIGLLTSAPYPSPRYANAEITTKATTGSPTRSQPGCGPGDSEAGAVPCRRRCLVRRIAALSAFRWGGDRSRLQWRAVRSITPLWRFWFRGPVGGRPLIVNVGVDTVAGPMLGSPRFTPGGAKKMSRRARIGIFATIAVFGSVGIGSAAVAAGGKPPSGPPGKTGVYTPCPTPATPAVPAAGTVSNFRPCLFTDRARHLARSIS